MSSWRELRSFKKVRDPVVAKDNLLGPKLPLQYPGFLEIGSTELN